MSSFWGTEVKPEKPYTHSPELGRLRLTQATLGAEVGRIEKGKRNVVKLKCTVDGKEPVFLCAMLPGQSETCHLDLEFEENHVTFAVLGPMTVHLAGYYISDAYEKDMCDSDTCSDSLQGSDDDGFVVSDDDDMIIPASHRQMSTDSKDDDLDYDSETDDEDLMYNQGRGKSSVVIEEIQEDDKSAGGEGQKGSNNILSGENGDNSQLQLVVSTPPAESMDSEDEDGFPVSEAKKSSKGGSRKDRNLNSQTSNVDQKRKNGAISSGEDENDRVSKKKKISKDKKENKQDSSANPVDAEQKKKKNKDITASEACTDQQANEKIHTTNDAEELTTQGAKKKKNKKAQEKNMSENQAQKDLMEPDCKEQPSQTRTFGNGLIIQTIALGKPSGKKASPGKKVSVKYIGKLKNGTIFDCTVGSRPFEFRLGVGQVIKGWDVGVNGMRIGDKRKLTIPPSMGYGSQKVGQIPPNSTLVFDVELVNVK